MNVNFIVDVSFEEDTRRVALEENDGVKKYQAQGGSYQRYHEGNEIG